MKSNGFILENRTFKGSTSYQAAKQADASLAFQKEAPEQIPLQWMIQNI